MIGKNTFKLYEITSISEYFDLIINSYINGNFTDVKSYFKKLDKEQKKEFFNYLEEINFNERFNLMGYLLK